MNVRNTSGETRPRWSVTLPITKTFISSSLPFIFVVFHGKFFAIRDVKSAELSHTKLLRIPIITMDFQNGMAILNACTVLRDRLKPYRYTDTEKIT